MLEEMQGIRVPIVAVLGNHDYHENSERELRLKLERNRVIVLEGESTVLTISGQRLGVAGTKGFGGGFPGACASAFGEPEMKAFIHHTERLAERLAAGLKKLGTDYRIAVLHYAPIQDTLQGERLEIYPFLGSYLLAEAVDRAGADLIVHGHAHLGKEKGLTAGGVPVRNVALPVLKHAYAVYYLGEHNGSSTSAEAGSAE